MGGAAVAGDRGALSRLRVGRGLRACRHRAAIQPFVDALTELVQAQADTSSFVVLHRWVEILERHFPPHLPDPDNVAE